MSDAPPRWIAERCLRIGLCLAALLPALLWLGLLGRFGVDFHYLDDWDPGIAGLQLKAYFGQLRLADLFELHNEHRIVLPRIAWLILGHFTGWDALAELRLSWLTVVVSSFLLLILIARSREDRSVFAPRVLFTWLIVNQLLFIPAQWENMMGSIGLSNLMPVALTLASVLVAGSSMRPMVRSIGAAVSCVAAMYCSGSGFLAWPVSFLILAWSEDRSELKRKTAALAVFCSAWIVSVGTYFIGYVSPQTIGPATHARGIGEALQFFLPFLGNAFAYSQLGPPITVSTAAGVLMLVALLIAIARFVVAWRGGDATLCRRMLPWLALGGFAIGAGILASRGRAGSGIDHALSPRYVTFSLMLPIAIVGLLPLVATSKPENRVGKILARTGVTAIWLLTLATLPVAIEDCVIHRLVGRQCKAVMLMANILPDNPRFGPLVHPDIEGTRKIMNELNAIGYIHPPLISSSDARLIVAPAGNTKLNALGAIDSIRPSTDGNVLVEGWAVFRGKSSPADSVFLTYTTPSGAPTIFALADIGSDRPDVASLLRDGAYLSCGWSTVFPAGKIPEGARASIRAWAFDTASGKGSPLNPDGE